MVVIERYGDDSQYHRQRDDPERDHPAARFENLYATDLAYLQDLYNQINDLEKEAAVTVCPQCHHSFTGSESARLGGS